MNRVDFSSNGRNQSGRLHTQLKHYRGKPSAHCTSFASMPETVLLSWCCVCHISMHYYDRALVKIQANQLEARLISLMVGHNDCLCQPQTVQ